MIHGLGVGASLNHVVRPDRVSLMAVAQCAMVANRRQGLAAVWLPLAVIEPPPWCASARIRKPRMARLGHSLALPHSPLSSSVFVAAQRSAADAITGHSASPCTHVAPSPPS